jgi:uncharacterized protein YggE
MYHRPSTMHIKHYLEVIMRTKLVIPVVIIIAAALLSACSGTIQFGQAQPRTISVTGIAQVLLTPDIAYISIGVETQDANAQTAVANNNTKSQAVIDAIKSQGVAAADIQTSNFSISQQTQTGPNGETQGIIFVVDNTVYMTMHDLTKIGAVLDASIAAGANNIYGITFDVQNKETALASGRDQAMADAQTQAEQLAKAAGATLGPAQTITYYNSSPQPIYESKAAVVGAGGGVPISTGQLSMTVSVNVTYELK